ncbi:hypothetical protein GCM10010466_36860 [Planomonospora alba]|uniref:Uncharacterized protein n=1 Tax=Planomonospora alba TaxID=161354 RepID=A0ABP6NB89_9ACTN
MPTADLSAAAPEVLDVPDKRIGAAGTALCMTGLVAGTTVLLPARERVQGAEHPGTRRTRRRLAR